MAIVYLRNSTGSDSNNGSSWAQAKATYAEAFAVAGNGGTIYVSQNHYELTLAGTSGNDIRVLGVDDTSGEPPTKFSGEKPYVYYNGLGNLRCYYENLTVLLGSSSGEYGAYFKNCFIDFYGQSTTYHFGCMTFYDNTFWTSTSTPFRGYGPTYFVHNEIYGPYESTTVSVFAGYHNQPQYVGSLVESIGDYYCNGLGLTGGTINSCLTAIGCSYPVSPSSYKLVANLPITNYEWNIADAHDSMEVNSSGVSSSASRAETRDYTMVTSPYSRNRVSSDEHSCYYTFHVGEGFQGGGVIGTEWYPHINSKVGSSTASIYFCLQASTSLYRTKKNYVLELLYPTDTSNNFAFVSSTLKLFDTDVSLDSDGNSIYTNGVTVLSPSTHPKYKISIPITIGSVGPIYWRIMVATSCNMYLDPLLEIT